MFLVPLSVRSPLSVLLKHPFYVQAPVPYLNRAISKESLGVAAAARGDDPGAYALWRSALADCDAAIERDPKEFAAWFDRGNIRMRLEQWGDALTDFSTAADLAPGLPGGQPMQAWEAAQAGWAHRGRRLPCDALAAAMRCTSWLNACGVLVWCQLEC